MLKVARKTVPLLGSALLLLACSQTSSVSDTPIEKKASMGLIKITPVLLAKDLEACVKFWNEFGFETTISVPYEDKLAFVSLKNGPLEIMYQSFVFSKATNPIGIEGVNRSVLYLETDSLNDISGIAGKYEVVIPEHTTPHGSREIYVRDPAGNLVGFAQQGN